MPTNELHERPALLEARRLAFARNDEPVFGPLDFVLRAGEVVLIEGTNGSGKSTLLRVLCGLLAPTSGEIRLNGEPLTLALLSPQVALLSHQTGLKLELTALENLRFAAGLGGLRAGISPPTALAGVGLDGYADVPVRQLSAGQKKRVALARVLLAPVDLWLLDEPYANLDLDGIRLVNRLLENHATRGGAALITSHGAYAYTSGTPQRVPLRAGAENRTAEAGSRSEHSHSEWPEGQAAEAASQSGIDKQGIAPSAAPTTASPAHDALRCGSAGRRDAFEGAQGTAPSGAPTGLPR